MPSIDRPPRILPFELICQYTAGVKYFRSGNHVFETGHIFRGVGIVVAYDNHLLRRSCLLTVGPNKTTVAFKISSDQIAIFFG
jgi:hypothetical protein